MNNARDIQRVRVIIYVIEKGNTKKKHKTAGVEIWLLGLVAKIEAKLLFHLPM